MAIEGVLIDVDGVLVTAWRTVPGAAEALRELRRREIPFLLATNATSHSREGLSAKLRQTGLDVEPDRVVTAPVLTASYLRSNHPRARCYLLGEPELGDEFADIWLVREQAGVVVVAGADPAFTWENLSRAFRMLKEGAALVAMHRNLSWMTDTTKQRAQAKLAACAKPPKQSIR